MLKAEEENVYTQERSQEPKPCVCKNQQIMFSQN